jgi:hypothetical protein
MLAFPLPAVDEVGGEIVSSLVLGVNYGGLPCCNTCVRSVATRVLAGF